MRRERKTERESVCSRQNQQVRNSSLRGVGHEDVVEVRDHVDRKAKEGKEKVTEKQEPAEEKEELVEEERKE